jgi:hypothetical protein
LRDLSFFAPAFCVCSCKQASMHEAEHCILSSAPSDCLSSKAASDYQNRCLWNSEPTQEPKFDIFFSCPFEHFELLKAQLQKRWGSISPAPWCALIVVCGSIKSIFCFTTRFMHEEPFDSLMKSQAIHAWRAKRFIHEEQRNDILFLPAHLK